MITAWKSDRFIITKNVERDKQNSVKLDET